MLSRRGGQYRTGKLAEVVGKTIGCPRLCPIRRGHRQARVSVDGVPAALEPNYQIDVLAAFKSGEAAHTPVRVGAASEVGSVDVVMSGSI